MGEEEKGRMAEREWTCSCPFWTLPTRIFDHPQEAQRGGWISCMGIWGMHGQVHPTVFGSAFFLVSVPSSSTLTSLDSPEALSFLHLTCLCSCFTQERCAKRAYHRDPHNSISYLCFQVQWVTEQQRRCQYPRNTGHTDTTDCMWEDRTEGFRKYHTPTVATIWC